MVILAIGPHPDDIEFGCAAILIKEIKKGNHVKLLVLSRGEAGTAAANAGRSEPDPRGDWIDRQRANQSVPAVRGTKAGVSFPILKWRVYCLCD